MRAIFGLAGLLITIGIIIWIMKTTILPYDQTVITQGKKARQQASQIAGIDPATGLRVSDTITLAAQSSPNSGQVVSVLVTQLTPGSPMENYFGLMRDDTITAIQGFKVRDLNDGELAKAMILESYQRKQTLTVVRNGQELELPLPVVPANAGATPAPGASPAPRTAGAQQGSGQASTPLQDQLNAVQAVPTH